eukprot:evm.model.scf_865.2 EVM.evm.TU.scf_865.2   scf_865:11887-15742(-)
MSGRQLTEQLSAISTVSEDTWLPEAVERDPSGRFWRYDEVLGKGAFKFVYKAFDEQEGMEVAWNKVNLVDTASRHTQRTRLFAEIETLKRLKHKNIMTFIDSWLDEKTDTINFITELFADGSLSTPEFMAPEFYNEKYDEKVDVYAFGMLLLELVTMQYPYSECTNAAQIYKKVSQGVYPAALQKIENEELRDFIELCISYDPRHRPAARQLLKNDFFKGIRQCMDKRQAEDVVTSPSQTSESEGEVDGLEARYQALVKPPCPPPSVFSYSGFPHNFAVQRCASPDEEHEVLLQLNFNDKEGKRRAIQFPFNLDEDTPAKIVQEMLEEHCHLSLSIGTEDADYIGTLIAQQLPDGFKSFPRSVSCPTLSEEADPGQSGTAQSGEAAGDASPGWGLTVIPEDDVPQHLERKSLEGKRSASASQELSTRFQISP